MTHVTCRLTAKNRDQLRNPTLGNRAWATFTLSMSTSACVPVRVCTTGDGGEDKVSVSVVDGSVQVRVRLGTGSFDAELRPPLDNVRYDDGRWHHVVVSRQAREVRFTRLSARHCPHFLLRPCPAPASNRPISPVRRALSSKPDARCCSGQGRPHDFG